MNFDNIDIFFLDGYYVYTDNAHSPAYLVSPGLSFTYNTSYCLSFWYYVYGQPASAQLLVFIRSTQMNGRPEWSRIIGSTSEWTMAQVTIDVTSSLQVTVILYFSYFAIKINHWRQIVK